jgi:DNA-binding PadR family transcriptional regulator
MTPTHEISPDEGSDELNATAASMLGFLSERPATGWELYARFEENVGRFWSVTRSQIYRELQALAVRGLVEIGTSGARDRRICSITQEGRSAFVRWIGRMPGRELIRFPLLLTIYFGAAVPPEALREAAVAHRREHAARLEGYEARIGEVRVQAPFPALSMEFGILYERAVLEWIDALPWMKAEAT